MAVVFLVSNQLCNYVFFSRYLKRISYIMFLQPYLMAKKELLDVRTAITHLGLDVDLFFNKQDAQDILQTSGRADIPVICKRKRRRCRGQRAGCLVRTRKR